MDAPTGDAEEKAGFELARQRVQILRRVEHALEVPMIVLGGVWLILMVVDLVSGLPRAALMLVNLIWILFILDFLLRFSIAPRKLVYLRRNWLTVIALLLPALRAFRTLARLISLMRREPLHQLHRVDRLWPGNDRNRRRAGRALEYLTCLRSTRLQ